MRSRGLMLHTQERPNARYELDNELSGTSFSCVRSAVEIETDKGFAIKAGNKLRELNLKDREEGLWNEIVIMRKLKQPNIFKLLETLGDDSWCSSSARAASSSTAWSAKAPFQSPPSC
jgi:hypothetical protein